MPDPIPARPIALGDVYESGLPKVGPHALVIDVFEAKNTSGQVVAFTTLVIIGTYDPESHLFVGTDPPERYACGLTAEGVWPSRLLGSALVDLERYRQALLDDRARWATEAHP